MAFLLVTAIQRSGREIKKTHSRFINRVAVVFVGRSLINVCRTWTQMQRTKNQKKQVQYARRGKMHDGLCACTKHAWPNRIKRKFMFDCEPPLCRRRITGWMATDYNWKVRRNPIHSIYVNHTKGTKTVLDLFLHNRRTQNAFFEYDKRQVAILCAARVEDAAHGMQNVGTWRQYRKIILCTFVAEHEEPAANNLKSNKNGISFSSANQRSRSGT